MNLTCFQITAAIAKIGAPVSFLHCITISYNSGCGCGSVDRLWLVDDNLLWHHSWLWSDVILLNWHVSWWWWVGCCRVPHYLRLMIEQQIGL